MIVRDRSLGKKAEALRRTTMRFVDDGLSEHAYPDWAVCFDGLLIRREDTRRSVRDSITRDQEIFVVLQ